MSSWSPAPTTARTQRGCGKPVLERTYRPISSRPERTRSRIAARGENRRSCRRRLRPELLGEDVAEAPCGLAGVKLTTLPRVAKDMSSKLPSGINEWSPRRLTGDWHQY